MIENEPDITPKPMPSAAIASVAAIECRSMVCSSCRLHGVGRAAKPTAGGREGSA
jgi:hypothetical protein